MKTVVLVLLLVAVFLLMEHPQCAAFLLSNECLAPPPCTCSGSSGFYIYIDCNAKHLSHFPTFKKLDADVSYIYIYLNSNNITSIPNGAFANFSSLNAAYIHLGLEDNNINTIGYNAFSGFLNITTLVLPSNNLTVIPSAVGQLAHLKNLYIGDNPLRAIDSSVMPYIGRSLIYLDIDFGSFTSWPNDLHYLRILQTLYIRNIPFPHLDVNTFHGFENTLTSLTLHHGKLEKVPCAVCNLTHLTYLTIRNNQNLTENASSIFESCFRKLSSVTSLVLSNDGLNTFPYVFSLFPNLTTLNLDHNKFDHIEDIKLPSVSKQRTIRLSNNNFERIPLALNKLQSLESIYLKYNKIKTIEAADVAGLMFLGYLDLYGNPLVHISPFAFKHNLALYFLIFENTKLDHVPEAVINLPNLREFYLSGTPINCTCDMFYLKHWNVSAVLSFSTRCASSTETIKTFITTDLQLCP